ncbi:TMV resistance protein N-like [Abrus precatorius]|uniref:TMV resistance protein N-like n=1 Tax=Abrus precatorius TaxID=3816 RepID=A0A8B8JZX2_ABRPR|nr:TMV resistance protein N-like [Abrus precatorius]
MSASSSNPIWIYDVFLNFRGEDTRRTIVSHLYNALLNAGVNTFMDDHKLPKGTELQPELLQVIEGSHISIVVLSKGYVRSAWCLNELEQIMQCRATYGQVVLPIFYDVDPSDVRHQKGAFGDALEAFPPKRYEGSAMKYVLSGWRSALTGVANLCGWDLRNYRSEGDLVKEIVRMVLSKLDNTLLSITEFPVGLEARTQQVIEFIENQSNKVCIVGIWGMGGSGKTTTAKAIYNQIHRDFEDRSFIENIREVCEKDGKGHIHLQEQLLADVLMTKIKIHSIGMGTTIIEKRLRGKRLLVVLDDVSEFEQLQALCGNRRWIGEGSVIIVTTRDVRLLNVLQVDCVYQMEEMNKNESLELFSWHAFMEANPREEFVELSRNVVAYCGGLPLALEVLGAYLYQRTKKEWNSVLSKLEIIPNDRVQEKLRISFDGLRDQMEKDIFLDICCFFIGKDRAYVTEILNGCGLRADIGITVLIERSLIKVEKNNKLGVHDLLRDTGREIIRETSAREPGKRSRLWFHEDVLDVLTKNNGTEAVEGLALKLHLTSRDCFKVNAFEEMRRLRLLQLDHVQLTGDYGYLSKKLRWIYWQGFPLKHLPNNFCLENVIAIDVKHSNLKLLWKEPQVLGWLKILNLSHSKYLTETPDFSKMPNLEKLILKDCPSLCKVHQSIGDLHNLHLINLKDCTKLSNLPRVTYKLKSVKTLILSGCLKIDKLEEDIVQMESLTTLIAENIAVKHVPFSIVRSKSIGYISLCGFEGLSRNVFPSIIWSWMSPTMNPLSHIQPFSGISSSLVSMDVQNNNMGDIAPILGSLSNLRSVLMLCETEFQLSKQLRTILDDVYGVNFTELEITSYSSQISNHSLRSYLIGIGSYQEVFNALSKSISEGLATNESCDVFLPGDNDPYWLTHTGDGNSVYFSVPKDCHLKGMTLCVIYSSTPENTASEYLISVIMVNYTKCTIQIYKRDTVISFNDEDWQGLISHLGSGDKVEIFVTFGKGLEVKRTTVYLMYDESIDKLAEPSAKPKKDDMEMETSPKPKKTNMEMETSPKPKKEPKKNDMEMETSPKPKKKTIARFLKKIVMCKIQLQ